MSTRYTKDHEWIRLEGDVAVCGISVYAADQLGDVVYVELPEIGKAVKAGDAMAVVESAKAASDVYSPIAGVVVAVNDALGDAPQMVNEGPEAGGWFCRIKPANVGDLATLMSEDDYKRFIEGL